METILYICTAALTVAWSVFTYIAWSDKERRGEYVVGRFFLMLGPSAYFLLLILAGWSRVQELRLDLVGIAVLDVLTAACWLGLLLARVLRPGSPPAHRTVFVRLCSRAWPIRTSCR